MGPYADVLSALTVVIKAGRHMVSGAVACTLLLYGGLLLPADAGVASPEACKANQLDAGFIDREGLVGTQMVLRNTSPRACRLKRWPAVEFEGDDGEPLVVERRLAPLPGHVAIGDLTLAPGAAVSATLAWETRDIDKVHNCMAPLMVVVDIPGGALRFLFGRQMCAAGGSLTVLTQGALMPQEKGRR